MVDNPWWAIYSQQCPQCKQQQVRAISHACLPACLPSYLRISLPAYQSPSNLLFCSALLCCRHQIPRIDINAPSNAIELDPNVSALYGEGVADSSDECEEGSVGEEEVEE